MVKAFSFISFLIFAAAYYLLSTVSFSLQALCDLYGFSSH